MSVISETRMIMKVKGLSGGTWGSKRSQFAPGWLMYAWSVFGNKHLLDWRPDVSPLIFLYSNRERILESESELIINIRKAVSHYTVYINPDADSKDAQCGFIYIYIYIYMCIHICMFCNLCSMKGFANFILLSSPVLYNDELSCNCRKAIMEEAAWHPSQQSQ